MKSLQVRNVPEQTHRELRIRAAAAGVSLSDYALAELERITARPPIADVLMRAQNRSGGLSREDALEMIRAGREQDQES